MKPAPSVAVVIPFYQRRSGILRTAVESVLAQRGSQHSTVIVVDDASPVPARTELGELMLQHPGRIVIMEQANGGPAAARNAALNALPSGTDYVAFLDSDDAWIPEHLERAVTALSQDGDFYFSDHYQLRQNVSAFRRGGRIDVAQHPALAGAEALHRYHGDMFDQILSGNIIGTSTVVYRLAAAPALRFREEFVYAGEDYLFWLELTRRTGRIVFSALCECTYGEGVNIFSGSGWGSENSLLRLHHEMKYKKSLPRLFELSPEQQRANSVAVRQLRRGFVADLLHRLLHRRSWAPGLLGRQWRVDPQTFLWALPLTAELMLQRCIPRKKLS